MDISREGTYCLKLGLFKPRCTRPLNTANTVKVWSFEKVRSMKNTTKFNTNTIGFYAIKGNRVSKFLDNSKAPSIASFLNDIKTSNDAYQAIVLS